MKKHILLIIRVFALIIFLFSVTNIRAEDKMDSLIVAANNFTAEGSSFLFQKSYNKAIEKFDQSINTWEQVTVYSEFSAYPHFQLAILYQTTGNFEKSIIHYIAAEKILINASPDYLYLLAGLYSNIGYFYITFGDYQKSFNYYSQSVKILEPIKAEDMVGYSDAYFGVCQTLYYQHKFQRAIDVSFKYLESNDYDHLSYKKLIGNIYVQTNRIDLAIKYLNEVVAGYRIENESKFAESNLNLAKAYIKNGNLQEAENSLNEAYPILLKIKAERDPWMVYYYEIFGQLLIAKAGFQSDNYLKLALYNEAIDVFDKALELNAQGDKGKIPYLEGEGDFITPTQVNDVFISRTMALKEIANIYQQKNDLFTERNFLDRALKTSDASIRYLHDLRISFLDEESKLNLSEQNENVYLEAFNIAERLYSQSNLSGYFEKMLEFSEAGKSATFLASLNDVKAKNFGGIPDSLVQKERNVKLQLSNLRQLVFNEKNLSSPDSSLLEEWEQSIFIMQNEHDELIFQFESEYPDFYDFKYKNSTITAEHIVDKLKRNQALVEYVIDEPIEPGDTGFLYVMTFQSSGYSFYKKPISYSYISNLHAVISELTNKNIGESNTEDFNVFSLASNSLYKELIDPLPLNEHVTELIIVPDGKLSYLPFDALLTKVPEMDVINYRSLDYLVYDYNITYSYSATLQFDYFKSKKKSGKNILAFAPEYENNELDINKAAYRYRQVRRAILRPLPGARDEVLGLSEFQECKALLGDSASEVNFKKFAGNYDILHLAMHTIINDSIPMFSKLVFSQPKDSLEDGYLNTQEIYNLKLDARLTVLSACNTGAGKMRTGEGVMSLSRAFLFAGCPSIVMTLWEVEDKASAELMIAFYRYLFKGYTKPEALRKAKLLHIKNADPLKAHPYFWLGYIFVGDPSPIKFNNNVLIAILVFSAILLIFWQLVFRLIGNRKKAQK